MGKIIVIDTETVTGTYGLLSVGAVVLERDVIKSSRLIHASDSVMNLSTGFTSRTVRLCEAK